MEDNLETLEIEGGNTNNPLHPPKKQVSQLLHWCFTWNNYQQKDIETLETLFKFLGHKYCFQEECGNLEGTPHLQGVVSLKKKMRWTEFGLPPQIHWEKTKSLTNAYIYCSKEETRVGKCFTFNYKVRAKLKLITPEYDWQLELINLIDTEPNERHVYWYWSHLGGVGKSQFCKYLVAKKNAVFFEEGKKSDIMKLIFDVDMDDHNLIVVDVPRDNGNNISYKSIESIKNGMIYSSKYEGGYKLFNSPHLIVFANAEPKYEALSSDRWKVREII